VRMRAEIDRAGAVISIMPRNAPQRRPRDRTRSLPADRHNRAQTLD
jgi:hypothetical protein